MSAETQEKAVAQAQFFNLDSPLLAQGRFDNKVARTDLMTMIVKVYASGGENALHMHPYEDHSFVILQGEATFHIGEEDEVRVLTKYEGVMLPRGVCYWFLSSAPENLVMLRVGAAEKWPEDGRAFPDGRPFAGNSKENKRVEMIPIPGEFFTADS
jgi:mannose-6-phosphate isomerase-like protein (cupin superfamily)